MKDNKKPAPKKGTLKRVVKHLFKFFPVMLPITLVCIMQYNSKEHLAELYSIVPRPAT